METQKLIIETEDYSKTPIYNENDSINGSSENDGTPIGKGNYFQGLIFFNIKFNTKKFTKSIFQCLKYNKLIIKIFNTF